MKTDVTEIEINGTKYVWQLQGRPFDIECEYIYPRQES